MVFKMMHLINLLLLFIISVESGSVQKHMFQVI